MSARHTVSSRASPAQARRHHNQGWEDEEEEEQISLGTNIVVSSHSRPSDRQVPEPRQFPKAKPKRDRSTAKPKKEPSRQHVQEPSGKREREHSRSSSSKHKQEAAKTSGSRSSRPGLFKTISGLLTGTIEVVPKRSQSRSKSRHRKESPADCKHQLKGGHSTDSTEDDNWSPPKGTTPQKPGRKRSSGSRGPNFRGLPEEDAAVATKNNISFLLPMESRTTSLTSVASQTVEEFVAPEEQGAKVTAPLTPSRNTMAALQPDDKTMPPHGGWTQTSPGTSSAFPEPSSSEWQTKPPTAPPTPPPQPTPSAPRKSKSSVVIKDIWSSITEILNPIPRTPTKVDKGTQTEPFSPKQQATIINNSLSVSPENSQNNVSPGHQPSRAVVNNRPSETHSTAPQEKNEPRQESKRSHTSSRGSRR